MDNIGPPDSPFLDSKNWDRFALRELGEGIWSYTEAIFAGNYVYFGTERTDAGAHCRMLRYDIRLGFANKRAWELFDASRLAGKAGSYIALAYDGRFLYFGPFRSGPGLKVEPFQVALKFDSTMRFSNPSAWSRFDMSQLHPEAGGFVGATHIGNSVYFAPYYSGTRSLFVRHDRTRDFTSADSWTVFDLMTVHPGAKGYMGATSDGRYVYYAPCYNDASGLTNSIMLRHDSLQQFDDPSSWDAFDLAAAKGNRMLGGYHGSMTFDGRYVYYTPLYAPKPCEVEAMHHGWLTRFDTHRPFGEVGAWETFDSRDIHPDVCGFSGAGFDGQHVYFCPVRCCSHLLHGRMLRFDSRKPFDEAGSYEVFDAQAMDKDLAYFDGQIAFDGTAVYYSAASDKGIMLRFRTRPDDRRIGLRDKLAALLRIPQ